MSLIIEKKQEATEANRWFKLHDIQSFIVDDVDVFVVVGDGFEIQISPAEISYRAELFRDNKE